MGGASAPTLFDQMPCIHQTGPNSVGAEAPPTKDLPRLHFMSDPSQLKFRAEPGTKSGATPRKMRIASPADEA
ncbi:DUF6053 domain-containing protein [Lysobacter sp. CA199]|uniref:DUF6053 domain-containing protein n=1 Tax=Lysobacter sp. CA199 TaxID=3455608 RepID=UPI003F8D4184